jgi:hypothetical protein
MLEFENPRVHISINQAPEISTYTATGGGGSNARIKERNRNRHGTRIRQMLENVKHVYDRLKSKPLPNNIIRDSGTYVEFSSALGHDLIAESLHKVRSGIELLSIKKKRKLTQKLTKMNI